MKKIFTTTLVLLIITSLSFSQKLTLLPEAGTEFSRFKTDYNDIPGLYTSSSRSVYLGVRLNYQNKHGHGPYLGVGFSNIGYNILYNGTLHSSSRDILRMEAGYHLVSKPLYFKRILDNGLSGEEFSTLKDKGWYIKFIPSVGIVYQQAGNSGTGLIGNGIFISTTNPVYRSNIGLSFRSTFEFGKNDKPKFTLSIGYVKGFGTLDRLTVDESNLNKQANFSNYGSGFHVTLGIPINLWKKNK